MWLENLRDLRARKDKSYKWIAEETNLPERTVNRIFSGETEHPYVDTVHRIVTVLGGSLDEVFADTKVVVGNKDTLTLQEESDALTAEVIRLTGEITRASAEITRLKDKVVTLTAENDILRLKVEHKDELLALHTYYIKQRSKE